MKPRYRYMHPLDPTHCVTHELTETDWWRRMRADKLETCGRWCEFGLHDVPKGDPLDMHHVIPRAWDGRLELHQANFLLCCRFCHGRLHWYLRYMQRVQPLGLKIALAANDNEPDHAAHAEPLALER